MMCKYRIKTIMNANTHRNSNIKSVTGLRLIAGKYPEIPTKLLPRKHMHFYKEAIIDKLYIILYQLPSCFPDKTSFEVTNKYYVIFMYILRCSCIVANETNLLYRYHKLFTVHIWIRVTYRPRYCVPVLPY